MTFAVCARTLVVNARSAIKPARVRCKPILRVRIEFLLECRFQREIVNYNGRLGPNNKGILAPTQGMVNGRIVPAPWPERSKSPSCLHRPLLWVVPDASGIARSTY